MALAMAWPRRAGSFVGSSGGGTEREPRDPSAGPSLAELTNHHVEPVHNLQAHISNGWQRAQGPKTGSSKWEKAEAQRCIKWAMLVDFACFVLD